MNRTLKIFLAIAVAGTVVLILAKELTSPTQISKSLFGHPTIHLLFTGDIMLDRGVARHARVHGVDSLFGKVKDLLGSYDAVTGNLEGTITAEASISEQDQSILKFTFDPSYAELLKDLNFKALSGANNHSLDFGRPGYASTAHYLTEQGIEYFGSALNDDTISTTLEIKGQKICLVGYHDLYVADETTALQAVHDIRASCDYLVLFAHWGEEYQTTENDRQKLLAHEFIDAGADLVIGAHPHVVQPYEIYKNKAIFYSLGNFMFDQDFSYNTTHGLIIDLEWNGEESKFKLIPTTLNRAEVSAGNVTKELTI